MRPGSYKVERETIGADRVVEDGFENDTLEWSTVEYGSCVLVGILVKARKYKVSIFHHMQVEKS